MNKLVRILAALACLGTFIALVADAPAFLLPWILWFLAASALATYLWPGGRTVVFVLVMLGAFVYIGALVTAISGRGGGAAAGCRGQPPSRKPPSSQAIRGQCRKSTCRRSA